MLNDVESFNVVYLCGKIQVSVLNDVERDSVVC